jgi:hypothetical protein
LHRFTCDTSEPLLSIAALCFFLPEIIIKMVSSSNSRVCCMFFMVAFCQISNGFLSVKQHSPKFGSRLNVNQLNMKQVTYKAAWWKNAFASLGILSSVIAVAPADSFAADTVKVTIIHSFLSLTLSKHLRPYISVQFCLQNKNIFTKR